MRLVDLDPRWVGNGGEGVTDAQGNEVPWREKVAISFECPCGGGCTRVCLLFTNPPDGGPPLNGTTWERAGDTFETMTLSPSILRKSTGCKWHGWIRNGEVIKA